MDEQPGQESPSYYKQLKYDGLFIDDYNGGRTVVEGQIVVSDDNVVGDYPDHGQGVAANDGNVVGEEEDQLQGLAAANDGNAVGEEENQLPRVEATYGVPRERMEMLGIYHNLVVERKGDNDKVIQVRLDRTVESIKRQIETLLGINASQQTLFFNGKRLEDSHIIESIRGNIAFNLRIELVVEADTAAGSGSGSGSAAQPSSASAPPQTFAVGKGKPSIAIITQTSSGGGATQVPAARSPSESDDASRSSPSHPSSDPEWEASPSKLTSSDSDWEPSTSTSSSAEGLPSSEELGSSRNNSARPTRRSERLRKREGS